MFFGGPTGTRTLDPLLAKQMLYQLSYWPERAKKLFLEIFPNEANSLAAKQRYWPSSSEVAKV